MGARFYLHREYSKDGCQPCADLEACQPLSLSLEAKQPWPRAGRTYTVWHRVTLKNSSCLAVPSFPGALAGGLSFKVWDSEGREVAPKPAARSEFGSVIPYRHAAGKAPASGALPPGEARQTTGMILSPYTLRAALMSIGTGRQVKTFNQDAEVPAARPRGAVEPPAGFQVLRGYSFSKPGKYTLGAVYKSGPTVLERIYPNYDALSEKHKGWLDQLAERTRLDLRPKARTTRTLLVESERAAFEVLP